ncbi:MAG: lamin tail domain-containing protein [Myxococcota bacterium]
MSSRSIMTRAEVGAVAVTVMAIGCRPEFPGIEGFLPESSSTAGESSSGVGSSVDEGSSSGEGSTSVPSVASSESSTSDIIMIVCGDGLVQGNEDCDGDDLNGEDCESLGYPGGRLLCADDCSFDEASCERCGNGMVDEGEQCDLEQFGGLSCQTKVVGGGFDNGELICLPNCTIDTSGCGICGNGTIEPAEACDSDNLVGQDCPSQGFGGGILGCATDCLAFDTTNCESCGNDVIEGDEVCDGVELDGQDCASLGQGFVGGVLGCSADCGSFDTSGCNFCGNDVIDGDESCDGFDLDGETCESQGFYTGTLACGGDCEFDLSGCTNCGNDYVDPGEDCEGTIPLGDNCLTLNVGYTGGDLGCSPSCVYDESNCTNYPQPTSGEVTITEIMSMPVLPGGQWFEVYNTTIDVLELRNCQIQNDTGQSFFITSDLPITGGGYRVFATDTDATPGLVPDYSWPAASFTLGNPDAVRLLCGVSLVDEVVYDGTFPNAPGQSMSLDPGAYDATSNDDAVNWCNNAGTPGAANPAC